MANTPKNVAGVAEGMNLTLTDQEFDVVVAIVEKTGNLAPEEEVVEQFTAGRLTPAMLTFFVPWMWAHRPDDSPVPAHIWRSMFEQVHYTQDKIVTTRPKNTVRAYRGATEANREGIAWSLDPGQANYFARYRQAPGETSARGWVTNIPAERVFARFMDGMEKEVTADVRGLDIRPIEEAHLLPMPRWWKFWRR